MKSIKKLIITLFAIALLVAVVFGIQFTVSADSASVSGISYTPSTAEQAKYVPNYVKTDNSVQIQTLYNPYTAKLALDLSGGAYSIGSNRWDDILVNEGYSDLQYVENLQLHLADRTATDGTTENIFSSVNVIMGIKKVKYNGLDKYAIAIAFRGTHDFADLLTDVKVNIFDSNGFHIGFKNTAQDFYNRADSIYFEVDNKCVSLSYIINQMENEDSEYCMLVTGHSLGGAVADVFSGYYLYNAGVHPSNIITYTFAAAKSAPYSYNYPYTNIINFINADDWVPTVGNDKQIGQNIVYSPDDSFRESTYKDKYISGLSSSWWSGFINAVSTGFVAHSCKESYMNMLLKINENTPSFFNYCTSANNSWSQSIIIDQHCFSNISGTIYIPMYCGATNNGTLIINGNMSFPYGNFQNYGILAINGNVGGYRGSIYNHNEMHVNGNIIVSNVFYFRMSDSNAILTVSGNMDFENLSYCQITGGTVILNGTEQQTIAYLNAKDILINNPSGVKYEGDIGVHGRYNPNGNPIIHDGYTTNLYEGSSLVGGNNYGNINISYVDFVFDESLKVNDITLSGSTMAGRKGRITISEGVTVEMSGTLYIPMYCGATNNGTLIINGNMSFPYGDFQNYGILAVNGNVGGYRGSIYNHNEMHVNGNIIVSNVFYFRMSDSNAILTVSGNMDFENLSYCQITGGTVILNGTEQQTIAYLNAKDILINNPSGVKYEGDIGVHGRYNSNGNPIIHDGYTTNLYEGSSLVGGNNYGNINISSADFVFDESLKVNNISFANIRGSITISEGVTVEMNGTLYLPGYGYATNNGTLTINGNISFSSGNFHNYGILAVNGNVSGYNGSINNHNEMHVNGNIINSNYFYFRMSDSNAILTVSGNMDFKNLSYCQITGGTVILNGTEQQMINSFKSQIIIIENKSEEGVVFSSSIFPSVLFDHRGNNFTLYNNGSGSTFIDYDGDGLKDNVDPHPTEALPCDYGHLYNDWIVDEESTPEKTGKRHHICSVCDNTETEIIPQVLPLEFAGSSLVLNNDYKLNFAVKRDLIDTIGYTNPFALFSVNGNELLISDYETNAHYYIFSFNNIQRDQLNSKITAILYATYKDAVFSSTSINSTVLDFGSQECDINGDGSVDIRDLIRLKKLMCNVPVSNESDDVVDLDFNGKLDALDLTYLIKMLLLI